VVCLELLPHRVAHGRWQAFAFIGLVSTIILQGIFSGGLSKPQWILTFSAFFHTVRLFGGNLGAVAMGHFIAQREKLHSTYWPARGARELDHGWQPSEPDSETLLPFFRTGCSHRPRRAVVSGRLRLEAYTLSIIDGFYLVRGRVRSLCC